MAAHIGNFKPTQAMGGNSRQVESSQSACHRQLGAVVHKHLRHPDQRPLAEHTRAAFESIRNRVEADRRPLIFDSFCGTGMSTGLLAQRYPDQLVIGIDKSATRLERHVNEAADDYLLVRADCGDFWRLAASAGWRLAHHFLLYPNPWPKPGQLKRRIHGSPAFSALLTLGGRIELRSNWQVYVEELGCALVVAGYLPHIERVPDNTAISLHESKYQRSGHQLWRCVCHLRENSRPHTAASHTR